MQDKFLEKLKTMETGAITDSLKLLGYDGWMVDMHPLNPGHRVCGRAFTMQFTMEPDPSAHAFNYYLLLDEIGPGDVIILAAGNCPYALMGENMQHASKKMGAAGVILDGRNRDMPVMSKYDQPVFSRGQEVKFMPGGFKLSAYQVPVICAGIPVRPGDYIIGDADGVIAIPEGLIESVLYQAERIVEIENQMDEAIEAGKSMKECVEIIGQKKFKRE